MEQNKPLMLFGEEAKVVLEMVNGQFRMRVIEGKLSEPQLAAAQKSMNEAQSIHQGEWKSKRYNFLMSAIPLKADISVISDAPLKLTLALSTKSFEEP